MKVGDWVLVTGTDRLRKEVVVPTEHSMLLMGWLGGNAPTHETEP